jgi:DNA-binding NarL/FixJ family response regulator
MTLGRAAEYALAALGSQASTGAQPHAKPADGNPLTARQREVVRLVARGLTNRQIAGNLDVAERTVDTHIEHILNKLGFGSRAQIAAWAVEQGLKAIEEPRSALPGVRSVQDGRPS